MDEADLKRGQVVLIKAFDDVCEHTFVIDEVYDDFVTGKALTGPLAGEYGEPEIEMILKILG